MYHDDGMEDLTQRVDMVCDYCDTIDSTFDDVGEDLSYLLREADESKTTIRSIVQRYDRMLRKQEARIAKLEKQLAARSEGSGESDPC